MSADLIVKNVYVGDKEASEDLEVIEKLEIKTIISIHDEKQSDAPDGIDAFHLSVQDRSDEDILSHLKDLSSRIHKGVRKGAVLVHCLSGISRSVTAVIAYLMRYKKMTHKDALKLAKAKREFAKPNRGFSRQLHWFEDHLFSETSFEYDELEGAIFFEEPELLKIRDTFLKNN